jgi:hypothetical protein
VRVLDLEAFLGQRANVSAARQPPVLRWVQGIRGSDDPAVTFGGLAAASVPAFADGCRVELSDGSQPPFRVIHPADAAAGGRCEGADPADPGQLLITPFRATGQAGFPAYAGIVTHWWLSRPPSGSDAAIAELVVQHLIALVRHERLLAALVQAEDQAASLALAAISGRTISLATGIVMCQHQLGEQDAEAALRDAARSAGLDLAQIAAAVVRARAAELGSAKSANSEDASWPRTLTSSRGAAGTDSRALRPVDDQRVAGQVGTGTRR